MVWFFIFYFFGSHSKAWRKRISPGSGLGVGFCVFLCCPCFDLEGPLAVPALCASAAFLSCACVLMTAVSPATPAHCPPIRATPSSAQCLLVRTGELYKNKKNIVALISCTGIHIAFVVFFLLFIYDFEKIILNWKLIRPGIEVSFHCQRSESKRNDLVNFPCVELCCPPHGGPLSCCFRGPLLLLSRWRTYVTFSSCSVVTRRRRLGAWSQLRRPSAKVTSGNVRC